MDYANAWLSLKSEVQGMYQAAHVLTGNIPQNRITTDPEFRTNYELRFWLRVILNGMNKIEAQTEYYNDAWFALKNGILEQIQDLNNKTAHIMAGSPIQNLAESENWAGRTILLTFLNKMNAAEQ